MNATKETTLGNWMQGMFQSDFLGYLQKIKYSDIYRLMCQELYSLFNIVCSSLYYFFFKFVSYMQRSTYKTKCYCFISYYYIICIVTIPVTRSSSESANYVITFIVLFFYLHSFFISF